MFTPAERARIRDALAAAAREDARIASAAFTGSSSTGREDRWSDIDLSFGVAEGASLDETLADWTDRMYREHGAIADVDMRLGATVYRVFLLPGTLQVDIAFSPAAEFGPIAPTFRLLFGTARPPRAVAPSAAELAGLGWLHALHVRSSLARGKVWQAEYMIGRVRDYVLALACLRHDLPAIEGRGIDRLPPAVNAPIADALVRSLEEAELRRAFGVALEALQREIGHVDAGLAARLAGPLRELAAST